jgi:hypothetical protein
MPNSKKLPGDDSLIKTLTRLIAKLKEKEKALMDKARKASQSNLSGREKSDISSDIAEMRRVRTSYEKMLRDAEGRSK